MTCNRGGYGMADWRVCGVSSLLMAFKVPGKRLRGFPFNFPISRFKLAMCMDKAVSMSVHGMHTVGFFRGFTIRAHTVLYERSSRLHDGNLLLIVA
jgi:hypothetical protein